MLETQTTERNETADLLRKIGVDPWEWLHYVHTKDEVDPKTPRKKFPVHLPYLKLLVRIWQKEKLLLIPKSRRMKVSWTMIGCHTHSAMFEKERHYAFVSKKEEHADELIKRARYIMENMDSAVPKAFCNIEYKFNHLYFPNTGSRIQGFPQGADQLRQFTFSGILFDEWAFLDQAEKMYSASFPTTEGGGRITGISSPSPGFFKRLVFDRLDEAKHDFDSE